MSKRKLSLANNPLFSGPPLKERERALGPYREIALGSINTNPNQPRKFFDQDKLNELAESIKTYGVLSPILVRPSKVAGRFNLVAGERRYRASLLAGREDVPAIIDSFDGEASDRTLAVQLVENVQRSDLAPLERALAIGAMRDGFSLSVRDIAAKLGISKSMVQRSLELLLLPDDLLNALKAGASESKILLLAKIEDPAVRASYLKDLDTLTRSEIETQLNRTTPRIQRAVNASAEDSRIIDEIQRTLGVKVRLIRSEADTKKGRLIVDFYSDGDLHEAYRRLVAE